MFTVSHVSITNKGQSFACLIDKPPSVVYHESVTGRTKLRATLSQYILIRDLDY
ncbi:hypothetical protein SK128_020968, partial [Halocaridina rubra]